MQAMIQNDEEDAVQRERNRDKALKNKSDESQTAIENIRQGTDQGLIKN